MEKHTGIIRRMDDLGRVVIPREVRQTLRLREGDPFEIMASENGDLILRKYSPIGNLSNFANEYCLSLYEASGHIALVCDRDTYQAVSGISKKQFMNLPVDKIITNVMDDRKTKVFNDLQIISEKHEFTAMVISPIVVNGDTIGAVIIASKDSVIMGNLEVMLAETASGFLAKQME